jgi:cell division protein FtsA
MIGDDLGAELSVSSCDISAARNLMLAIERCHLRVAGIVASPYAAGLSTLVDDEAELGAALIDFGGSATTIAAFAGDRLVHVDAIPVGGHHVTMDVARGLSISLKDAERVKSLHGACVASPADDRETIAIHRVGDDMDRPSQIAKSELVRIIKPRVEEILELARDRLSAAGQSAHAGRQLLLTGGASQLAGLSDLARAIVSPRARMGRPLGVEGLPESAKSPAFATVVGLMIYPQAAALEHFKPSDAGPADDLDDSYVARVRRWLKQSF